MLPDYGHLYLTANLTGLTAGWIGGDGVPRQITGCGGTCSVSPIAFTTATAASTTSRLEIRNWGPSMSSGGAHTSECKPREQHEQRRRARRLFDRSCGKRLSHGAPHALTPADRGPMRTKFSASQFSNSFLFQETANGETDNASPFRPRLHHLSACHVRRARLAPSPILLHCDSARI